MKEQRIIDQLKNAYGCIQNMNGRGYMQYMHQAKAEINDLPDDNDSRHRLQGEMLLVSIYESLQDFNEFCQKIRVSADMINGRSRVLPKKAHLFGGFYDVFSLCNNGAGCADDNVKKLEEAEEIFYSLTGGGRGTSLCYRAQLAYYRGDWQGSRIYANKALKQGEMYGQGLICLCAAEILVRLSKHTQDNNLYKFAWAYIKEIADGRRKIEGGDYRSYGEIIGYILDTSIGFIQTIPDWLRDGDMGMISTEWGFEPVREIIPAGIFGLALVTRIQYLTYAGKPVMALGAADIMEKVYNINTLTVSAYLAAFRAACYQQLGYKERTNEEIMKVLKLISPDKLWLIIAEFEPGLGNAIYEIGAQIDFCDIDSIREIGRNVIKKLEPIWKETMECAPPQLSLREREVAALLIEGRKNGEIAEALNISVRTVRTHLENIYRKKGITRRGQLLSAMKKKNIETAIWVKKI